MSKLVCIVFLLISLSGCTKKDRNSSEAEKAVDSALAETIARGQIVYKQSCIACHMADGLGAPPMNPPLVGTSFVKGDKNTLISIVLKGMNSQVIDGQKYHNVMPPLDFLNDSQIADVLTYVRNSFGNNEGQITVKEVSSLRE